MWAAWCPQAYQCCVVQEAQTICGQKLRDMDFVVVRVRGQLKQVLDHAPLLASWRACSRPAQQCMQKGAC